ncbi:NADP-dependent oxidoreductase [Gordonia desulfuricans]|uniref:NADP-dependent oxidoreductase n=1 Tax=Gordonia desulfuricans TaxID=89051 RepID=A0A7K3LT99_9ACTN|nr:NADP-dependent oxidoreductase [Gordonia desulfuricans]NDK90767.1 NADP-dependent oxidoreductase [Gordonia desulfuricans]
MSSAHHWVATGPDGLADFAFVETEVPAPGPGEVTIDVVAAGINPADLKHAARAETFPLPIGYEVSGRISAIGADTEIASGPAGIGDEVLAFRVHGGYATSLTVPASTVFAKPESLGFDEAAGLLLAGVTAADMIRAAEVARDELVVFHGASGAVGSILLQLARIRGFRVIGTTGEAGAGRVREFGGLPVEYGPGLVDRILALAGDIPIAAALDAVGTDDAVDTSLALVADRSRIVTVAAAARARTDGFIALGGRQPESQMFRDSVRTSMIRLAGNGEVVVPIAATYPLSAAPDAVSVVAGGHAGGKVVLRP